jgi:hypothetical protein
MADVKRPKLRWFLVLLVFAQGILYIGNAYLYTIRLQMMPNPIPAILERNVSSDQSAASLWLLLGTWASLGLASVMCSLGLSGRRRWAWTGAMVIEGVTLALALVAYFGRTASPLYYTAMGMAVAIVFTLNQGEIQVYYRTSNEAESEGPVGAVENTEPNEEGPAQWKI